MTTEREKIWSPEFHLELSRLSPCPGRPDGEARRVFSPCFPSTILAKLYRLKPPRPHERNPPCSPKNRLDRTLFIEVSVDSLFLLVVKAFVPQTFCVFVLPSPPSLVGAFLIYASFGFAVYVWEMVCYPRSRFALLPRPSPFRNVLGSTLREDLLCILLLSVLAFLY